MKVKIGLISALFCLPLLPASAQTPKEILAKSEALYKSAKTYQAEYTQKMDNELLQMLITGKIQTEGAKYRLAMTTKNKTMTTQQIMVSDGKNIIVYTPIINSYSKAAVKGGATPYQSLALLRIESAMKSPLKKLPDTTIDGAAMYVIEVTFGGIGSGKGTSTLFIDKKTHRLKRAINLIEKTKFVETYSKETFNAPIAPQTFVFTPPAGSKPLK